MHSYHWAKPSQKAGREQDLDQERVCMHHAYILTPKRWRGALFKHLHSRKPCMRPTVYQHLLSMHIVSGSRLCHFIATMATTPSPDSTPFPVGEDNMLNFELLAQFKTSLLQSFSLNGCQILCLEGSPTGHYFFILDEVGSIMA